MSDKKKKSTLKAHAPETTTEAHERHRGGLIAWLRDLWPPRQRKPHRVEVWQTFGRNKSVRGDLIYRLEFTTIDHARVADGIMRAARHDCATAGRESFYAIVAIDSTTRDFVVRRLRLTVPR